jgi:hypothetical protein
VTSARRTWCCRGSLLTSDWTGLQFISFPFARCVWTSLFPSFAGPRHPRWPV